MNLEELVAKEYLLKYDIENPDIKKTYIYQKINEPLKIKLTKNLSQNILKSLSINQIEDIIATDEISFNDELLISNIITKYYQKYHNPQNLEKTAKMIVKINKKNIIYQSLKHENNLYPIEYIINYLETLIELMTLSNIKAKINYTNRQKYTEIDQNPNSLILLLENIYYPNNNTHFWLTFYNAFQELPLNETYSSYSQAATTYMLKNLAKKGIIKIIRITKKDNQNKYNLQEYMTNLNSQDKIKNRTMYTTIFQKQRNITYEETIAIIKNIPNVNINDIKITSKNNHPTCSLKLTSIKKKLINPNITKEIKHFLEEIKKMYTEISDELKEETNLKNLERNFTSYAQKRNK